MNYLEQIHSLCRRLLSLIKGDQTNLKQFKGYLRYKMITSQNVPSGVQVKNFFFHRKVMSRSRDIQVFVFLSIPKLTKSVTS